MSTPNLGSVTFDHWTTQTIGKITPLYVRGTGFHQGGSRMVQVGSRSLIPIDQLTTKGLGFLKLDRVTHEPVALSPGVISVVKNTHTYVADSNALAALIDSVTENEIGILTSCDKFEGNPSEALRDAAERVGLVRLAAFLRGKIDGTDASSQRAYAAVFSGAGSETRVHQALESFESNQENAPAAMLSTFLIDGGIGTHSPSNELVSADPNDTAIGVVVNKSGRVGIGTRTPERTLDIDGDVNVRGTLYGNVVGQASTAQSWTTPRTLTLQGDIVGSIAWDGSANVSMSTSIVGSTDGILASVDAVGAVKYTGFASTEGAFYGGSIDPTGAVRLNYDGDLYASNFVGSTTGIDATMETLTCMNATVGDEILTPTLRCRRVFGNEGNFEGPVSATGFETVSDARWKRDIEPIEDPHSLLEAWTGVRFQWSDGREPGTQIGLLAQDVASTCPEGVTVGDDGFLRVRYGNLVAVLVEALKTQHRRIEALERRISNA